MTDGRCAKGWPSFWLAVVSGAASAVINGLVLPTLSTAFFNGGSDPCIGEGHTSEACKVALKKGSEVGSTFTLVASMTVFLMSPVIALCCDRFGRRPMMILVQVGNVASVLSILAVDVLGISLYVYYWLAVAVSATCGQVIFGLWIADRTTPEQRVAFFATLAATMDLEQVVTPLTSLVASVRNCLILSVALSLLALVATVCGIPESISDVQRREICSSGGPSRLFQMGIIMREKYRSLTILMLISNSAHAGCGAIFLFYVKARFGATIQDIAPIIFLNGINQLLVQLFVVKHLARCLSLRKIILLGYFIGALNCVVLGFVPYFHGLYILALTSGLGVIFTPAVQALYMNAATPAEMGQVQGAVTSLMTITGGLGPVLYSRLMVIEEDRGIYWIPYVLTIVSNFFCSWAVGFMTLPEKAEGDSLEVQLECS